MTSVISILVVECQLSIKEEILSIGPSVSHKRDVITFETRKNLQSALLYETNVDNVG